MGTSTDTEIVLTGNIGESFNEELSIYPMPVSNLMNINTGTMPDGNYTLRMMDVSGKTYITKEIKVNKDNAHHEIILDAIPQGVYTVVMQHDEYMFIKKIVKQ